MPEAKHKVKPQDYRRAQQLRREMSNIEKLVWHKLRQLPKGWGLSFRRQQPIHPYIVDFICVKHKLVIELDGFSHDRRQSRDTIRDDYLKNLGYTVLRFNNSDALENPDGIVSTIIEWIRKSTQQTERSYSSPLEGEARWGVRAAGKTT